MRTSKSLFAFLLIGCGKMPSISDVDATVSEQVSTVVTVNWTTDEATVGYIEYGPTDAYGYQTALETDASTSHSQFVLMPADTTMHYRVVVPVDDDTATSKGQEVTTGVLPAELPTLTVTGEGHDDYMAVPLLGGVTAPVVIGPDGEYLWYHFDERDLDVYRVRLSVDGESVLYNAASVSGDPAENSELVRVALDGSSEETIPLSLLAHDFVELPDGTITAMVVEYQDGVDGEEIRGDQLVEISADGTQSIIWSAWDCFDPEIDTVEETEFGWTFANALDYSEDEDAYYLSLRNFSSIVKINRGTGACEWVFGGNSSTIEIDGNTFLHQHQFQKTGDTFVVFDNEGGVGESRVLEYDFNEDAGTAEAVWSYDADDPDIYVFVLGDVTRFDDGDTMVTWSIAGQIDRVDSSGEVLWKLNTDLGYAFGFNTLTASPYAGDW